MIFVKNMRSDLYVYICMCTYRVSLEKSTIWCWSGLKATSCLHWVWPDNPVKATFQFYPRSTSEKYFFRGTLYLLPGNWSSNSSMASHGPSPTPTRTEEALYQIKLRNSFLPKDFKLFNLVSKINEFLI